MFPATIEGTVGLGSAPGVTRESLTRAIVEDLRQQSIEPKVDDNAIIFQKSIWVGSGWHRYALVHFGTFCVEESRELRIRYRLDLSKALCIVTIMCGPFAYFVMLSNASL